MDGGWYYHQGGNVVGPITFDALAKHLRATWAAAAVAKQATSLIPIVFAIATDRLPVVSSRVWRDRALTSPVYQTKPPILQPRDLKKPLPNPPRTDDLRQRPISRAGRSSPRDAAQRTSPHLRAWPALK
jgi:hypothetical protein